MIDSTTVHNWKEADWPKIESIYFSTILMNGRRSKEDDRLKRADTSKIRV